MIPALFFFLAGLSGLCAAENFRVDNEVRADDGKETVASTTYFLGDDFLSLIGLNGEITFFDAKKGTFTLLDPKLRIQTHLAATRTKDEIDVKRRQNATHSSPFVAFVAKPVFQVESDESSGAVSLQSTWFDYKLMTETPDDDTAKRYADFCDWSCYLNFRISRGHPTQLVRLEVNRILRDETRFPKSVSMSFFPKGKGLLAKEEKASSTHRLVRRLDEADKKRIDQAMELMRTLPVVPFDEYQEKAAEAVRPVKK